MNIKKGVDILYGIDINNILNITAEEGLCLLEDESIDLVITSPPYDNIRNYNNQNTNENIPFFDINIVVSQLYRVLKKGGSVIWVVSDETNKKSESTTSFHQAIRFRKEGFKLYDTMIFMKNNPVPKNHKRYEQAFEYIFMFTKNDPKTTNIMTQPCKFQGKERSKSTYRKDRGDDLKILNTSGYVNDYKIINNVFSYTVGKNEEYSNIVSRKHPAKFPILLARDQILSWSNKGDVVLDIFSGSGTTCIVSLLTDRKYLGFEKEVLYVQRSQEYINIVKDKIKNNDELIVEFKERADSITYKSFK